MSCLMMNPDLAEGMYGYHYHGQIGEATQNRPLYLLCEGEINKDHQVKSAAFIAGVIDGIVQAICYNKDLPEPSAVNLLIEGKVAGQIGDDKKEELIRCRALNQNDSNQMTIYNLGQIKEEGLNIEKWEEVKRSNHPTVVIINSMNCENVELLFKNKMQEFDCFIFEINR